MKIRTATLNDLDALTAVEAECFPAAEAATKKDFENRLAYYADHFWLMFDENDKLIAFVDGKTIAALMAYGRKYRSVDKKDELV